MRWLPDSSGWFKWRPYYEQAELDTECERTVSRFLEQKYGTSCYPVSTDDLTVMVEQETSNLDLYADLSGFSEDVEGLTDFFPDRKPSVKISEKLSMNTLREHRLRTTLAHEFGHVKFHKFLWDLVQWEDPVMCSVRGRKYYRIFHRLPGIEAIPETDICNKSSNLIDAPYSDWMEWQASYACGAFLMPASPVRQLVRQFFKNNDNRQWLPVDSDQAGIMAETTAEAFNVSADAARVRLYKLGFLQKVPGNYTQ
jgi:hypothetical protein